MPIGKDGGDVMENKKRLIDADALIEFASNHVGGMVDCNDIARFPTVDAVEVVHGRWILEETCGKHTAKFHCSVCDKIPKSLCIENYCPNCGAKMDGDQNETQ